MIHNFLYRIEFWWNSLFKYNLTKEEIKLYNSILYKDAIGYFEWYKRTNGDDICGHWIKDITEEEKKLIYKIHEYFYGKDWWIAIPTTTSQVCAVMLNDIKDKILYKTK